MTTANAPTDAASTERPRIIRTYRTRAYLSRAGHIRFDEVLAQQCLLYNAALQERATAWKGHRKRIGYIEQSRSLTAVRRDFPDIEGALNRRVQVGTLKRLDRAFEAFHRRVSAGESPGYPRFKSSRRWKTLEIYSGDSRDVRVDADTGKGTVRIKGMPLLRFKDARVPVDVQPAEIRISRRPNGIYLYLVFNHLEADPRIERAKNPVGINAGLSRVRWGFSDGTAVERRHVDNRPRRRLQRRVARQKMGSKSREKTAAQLRKHSHREQIRNRNELHRITAQLLKKYDCFAVEDLEVQKLTASARATPDMSGVAVYVKTISNRSMLEQTWGEFAQILAYKAEGAGMQFVRVDPALTSRTCSACGVIREAETADEVRRVRFSCESCGSDLNRSVNAAQNILTRGMAQLLSSAGEPDIAGRVSV